MGEGYVYSAGESNISEKAKLVPIEKSGRAAADKLINDFILKEEFPIRIHRDRGRV